MTFFLNIKETKKSAAKHKTSILATTKEVILTHILHSQKRPNSSTSSGHAVQKRKRKKCFKFDSLCVRKFTNRLAIIHTTTSDNRDCGDR